MSTICLVCDKNHSVKPAGSSSFKARAVVSQSINSSIEAIGKLNAKNGTKIFAKSILNSIGHIKPKEKVSHNLFALKKSVIGNIRGNLKLQNNALARITGTGNIKNIKADKFAGTINKLKNLTNFQPTEKLFPISDVLISQNNNYFVNKIASTGDLYSSIDEGVFTGNLVEHTNSSRIISDDQNSYIHPSSIYTSGDFVYKCEVTKPIQNAKESFLFIRAAAPVSNYSSDTPPQYKIYNIRLDDPSGNLIIKYKDIILRGDADYSKRNINYSTYISEPEVNNLLLYSWQSGYPLMGEPSGYTLNLNFNIQCLDDPFSEGFSKGYEDTCHLDFVNDNNQDYLSIDGSPLSTQSQGFTLNPTNSIRISAIEIANSGGIGTLVDNYLTFYAEVGVSGQLLTRNILPTELFTNSTSFNIYPEGYSVWTSSPDEEFNYADNTSASGAKILLSKLQNESLNNYITLTSTDPVNDSGRLTVKFSHQPPSVARNYSSGAFSIGSQNNDFDTAEWQTTTETDNYFVIENIELRVIAKKAIGSRDYALDIVGYSDDKILNITPKIGAFLQNLNTGSGEIPYISGFKHIDDLGISTDALSTKNQYFNSPLTTNDAGDHYKLSTTPLVSGTNFDEYIIPLKIYKDNVELGMPIDYSMSSYFENLYFDIYPLPTGATISTLQLIISYKPSNGLMLHTVGQQAGVEIYPRNIKIYPAPRMSLNDTKINSDINDGPLSLIEDIPQAYNNKSSLKTNYSRRWRGVDGLIVDGPFNANNFGFSFNNPQLSSPFLNGHFSFRYDDGNIIQSDPIGSNVAYSGIYNGIYENISNIGLRFDSQSLFDDATQYKTIDWTSITGYENHELYGKICDAYDRAVRVSGEYGNINFGNIDTSNGFSIFTRFTPDINISGVGYNLFNSGVLFAKWDSGNDLEFALGYENGYLCGYAKSDDDEIIKIQDYLDYSQYQYPLSVVLTYRDNTLYLYANNEIDTSILEPGAPSSLKAYSNNFIYQDSNSDFVIGFCGGSGIGINAFIHEIGISTYNEDGTNLVYDNPNKLYKQTTVESFLSGHSHSFLDSVVNNNKFTLWDYVNSDPSLWHIGDFKICNFSADFDRFTKRDGETFITHHLKHNGNAYSEITDLSLPSSIYTSGLCYHSQIENDFLRFNLSDIPNSFDLYAIPPRISKNIPRGYHFDDRAIVVETILNHDTNNDIIWNDGSVGPKLIVSLYTRNQDPTDRPSKINWGLVNRSTHYIKPSGCWQKISSTFKYNDLIDTSEPWANFDLDIATTELNHKYFSKDINDMFLQYDLVYPSGNEFDSKINIYSSHVKLEDALVKAQNHNDQLNLIASGEKKSLSNINLFTTALDISFNSHNLFIEGDYVPSTLSNLNIYVSGANVSSGKINLYCMNFDTSNQSLPIYVGGRDPRFNEENINLFTCNLLADQSHYNSIPVFISTNIDQVNEESFTLYVRGRPGLINYLPSQSFNLYIDGERFVTQLSENISLFIRSERDVLSQDNGLNLFTINYPPFNQQLGQQITITWSSNNVGKDITTNDNDYAYLDANDEIRGVDLMCYGDCNSSDSPCLEQAVNVHELSWSPPNQCVDGGVIRAKQTYTNLDVSGFKTPIGYSGHYYGIRKYTDLIPHAPYDIIIQGRTGSNKSIELPPKFTEIEYGINNYVGYSGIKFADNDSREAEDKYGKAVAIKNNLMAIGAPMKSVSYSEYDASGNLITSTLDEAGTVYLYRRDNRPSGDWQEGADKSPWGLETKLTLPSGLLKDYYTSTETNVIGGITLPLPITERHWQVGQEGRQFGHSLDIGINTEETSFEENSRQIVVVGGPSAKWSGRSFEELQASGVQIGLLIFTDEFKPTIPNNVGSEYTSQDILNAINNKDLIFQYFSDPPVRFDTKVIVCEPIADYTNRPSLDFSEPKPSFIVKKRIARNQGFVNNEQTERILSGIKDAFHAAFPYDETKLNNNIPALLGIYVDESRSLGEQAVNPALDNFISYFREYSFASGLRDFYDVRCSGEVIKYSGNRLENWILSSVDILNTVLDTGRLLANDQVRFFTSGVGSEAFNTNLSQFNYPPDSGGKVFIFEKESGSWNLIQEIKSPLITYNNPDRFGHAVAISDNTEIISIGSPYIGECCKIYEYKASEKERVYDELHTWVSFKSSLEGGIGYYANLLSSYNQWVIQYGSEYAGKILYSQLNSTDKFRARQYLNIEEYKNIYTYNGPTIIGDTWRFIINEFLPTSRLGYSTAVNEDGSIVAFGAPTDSLNKWDDSHVYYKNLGYYNPTETSLNTNSIQPSWRSNVNAGAVRLFESRKFYPHNTVVEYGKFGNLQKNLGDPIDSGYFNCLSSVFADKNFRTTEFTEVKIPTEAGLAFIITPAIDAASEEIINNIIEWLSLGDRNLVLVGNDPKWERGGVYSDSNDIINKILEALDSRMKLYPARNNFEALASGCSSAIPSFMPSLSTSSYVQPLQVPAYGVADIRLNLDNTPLKNVNITMPCDNLLLNTKCQLPIINGGDLRSEWLMSCYNELNQQIVYPVNLAYLFKTQTPPCYEQDSLYLKDIRIDLPNQEPIPLLVAATNTTQNTIIPATPAISGVRPIYEPRTIKQYSYVPSFDESNVSNSTSLLLDSGNFNNVSIESNVDQSTSTGLFYNPNLTNNRKGILQAQAIPVQEIIESNNIVSDKSYYCVEEIINTSKIVCIAGLITESAKVLYTGSSEDRNLNFYLNLVSKTPNINGQSNIAQLGGWTGRTSFKDAFNDSILYEAFQNSFNNVTLNVDTLYSNYDVCWIANPTGLPSQDEIDNILSWLTLNNKKLIITHDSSIDQVKLIDQLLILLNSKIKSFYLTVKDEYASSSTQGTLLFNLSHPISLGYDEQSSITSLSVPEPFDFIPFRLQSGVTSICYNNVAIIDKELNTIGYWKLDSGVTKISFPAISGSGYKLFINTISEVPSENQKLSIYISNASTVPSLPYPNSNSLFSDIIGNSYKINKVGKRYDFSTTDSITINTQVVEGSSSIDLYISSYNPRLDLVTNTYTPKTTQLLSISGVSIPIINNFVSQDFVQNTIIGYENYLVSEARPQQTITTSRLEPISNLNNQYCGNLCNDSLKNQLIHDGPVIAAQEIEHISSFNVGVNRSRITLLSDSALVQGRCVGDEFYRLSANTVQFLRSLYPVTQFPDTNNGRQYQTLTKIVAPERGSPQKYYAITNNAGSNIKFGGGNQASLTDFNDIESEYDPKYVIRPPEPWEDFDDAETKQEKINTEIQTFITQQNNMGGSTKFSGIIDDQLYIDAGFLGGMPDIMKSTGYDYLDHPYLCSGYPGDLFGYAISLYKNKLVVGSPFVAFSSENINPWQFYIDGGIPSGIVSSYNGGAGSAYVFEQTFKGSGLHGSLTPWQFIQKLRPASINAGQDLTDTQLSQSVDQLGNNIYNEAYLIDSSQIGDRFGSSVDISSDVIIVGSPGHDFDNFYINGSGSFIRKCFNSEFNIPNRIVIDLGSSGVRLDYPNSGVTVLNQGAIFAFENSITDWNSKNQKWTLVEKIIPQGYNSRIQNRTSDDNFGTSISLDRSFRSDADYIVIGGSYHHIYGSGNSENSDNLLTDAGAAYSYDIMLRNQQPILPSSGSLIDAKVFGDRDEAKNPTVRLIITNNNENNGVHFASGTVYSDNNGQIFIEVSGQDPSQIGFIANRPYIERIDGKYHYGTSIINSFNLFTSGTKAQVANMNIFTNVDNSSFVYNSIGLYNGAILGFASGIPSGLSLYLDCPDPISISESGLCLYTASGTGYSTDTINLSIRGR